MQAAIQEKRHHFLTADQQESNVKAKLDHAEKEMKECKGAEQLLRFNVLKREKEKLQAKLAEIQENRTEKKMHEYMAMMDQMERRQQQQLREVPLPGAVGPGSWNAKTVSMANRLHPPKPNRRNLFEMMAPRDVNRWKLLRAHKKRYSVMFDKPQTTSRNNPVDTCQTCGIDRVVDRETSISVCPKCGATRRFASHIFEAKESEKNDKQTTRQQSLAHMQKFSAQFERGYPSTTIDVLEPVAVAYSKIHLHDPSKVQACRTNQLLKSVPSLPKVYKRAPDRMTKELKGESIPEYTPSQLDQLHNQRDRLRTPEDSSGPGGIDDKKHKKSFSNQIYMRQLGRANHMEQSRLFPHAKTNKIHMERMRSMESECEVQKQRIGDQPGMHWSLYPST